MTPLCEGLLIMIFGLPCAAVVLDFDRRSFLVHSEVLSRAASELGYTRSLLGVKLERVFRQTEEHTPTQPTKVTGITMSCRSQRSCRCGADVAHSVRYCAGSNCGRSLVFSGPESSFRHVVEVSFSFLNFTTNAHGDVKYVIHCCCARL